MKAATFITKLDAIRSAARAAYGMGDNNIPADSGVGLALVALLAALRANEVVEDTALQLPDTPPTSVAEAEPSGEMKVTRIERDPSTKPNKTIVTEAATQHTVADAGLFSTAGDD